MLENSETLKTKNQFFLSYQFLEFMKLKILFQQYRNGIQNEKSNI